jgi:protoporphyrinogen oxidase
MIKKIDTLIIGGGITGLSLASFLKNRDYIVLEKSKIPGGYCKTKITNGFVWDYSGHFFHFKNDHIKDYVLENIDCDILEVDKITDIYYNNNIISFPFQHNIEQLPKEEYEECLNDLNNCKELDSSTFKSYVKTSLGNGICEKFIIPYNEKLYACDLDKLEHDSMGRFFPNNSKEKSYNDKFIYPVKGSYEYIKSILKRLDISKILTDTELLSLDLDKKIVTTSNGDFEFRSLVSTIPFDKILSLTGQKNNLSSNKVAVFNLGFNKGSDIKTHWRYFPGNEIFYRVGFYNNILNQERLSLYVEIGLDKDEKVNQNELLIKVLRDLKGSGIINDQELIEYEFILMNPAYVHITKESKETYINWSKEQNKNGIYSIGRYGSWTYCSIEDNIIQAKDIAEELDRYK